jgi:DNA-binding MarR family transcriptional regulator
VEWALWVGASIFALTIGGMFYMRGKPLRDAQGNAVNELGRPIAQLSSDANVVLITLHNNYEPLSSYELRRHVDMQRQNFYAMMTDLEHRNLITSQIEKLGAHNVRRYLLTENGRALFEERDVA